MKSVNSVQQVLKRTLPMFLCVVLFGFSSVGLSGTKTIFPPSGAVSKDSAVDAISEVAVVAWFAERCGTVTKKDMGAITDNLLVYLSRSQLPNQEIMRQFGIYTKLASDSYKSCGTNSAKGYLIMYSEWVNKLR